MATNSRSIKALIVGIVGTLIIAGLLMVAKEFTWERMAWALAIGAIIVLTQALIVEVRARKRRGKVDDQERDDGMA